MRRTKATKTSGGGRKIRRGAAGDEQEDVGRGFPQCRRKETAEDAGRNRTGGRVGGTVRVGHVRTIGIPEGVARIEGAEERRRGRKSPRPRPRGLRIEFCTFVILAIPAHGVPRAEEDGSGEKFHISTN
jgi:hypothetical protein